jgi:hypothetical protein
MGIEQVELVSSFVVECADSTWKKGAFIADKSVKLTWINIMTQLKLQFM